jgi:hypothetical protein
VALCYSEVNKFWRATHSPLTVEALHHNIFADFSQPIGAGGVLVYNNEFYWSAEAPAWAPQLPRHARIQP